MSANKIATLDKSRKLTIKARVNEDGSPITLEFLNSDGTTHAITSYDFSLIVKKAPSAIVSMFELTIGDGLTVSGAGNNNLTIELSQARATQKPDTYFYQLFSNDENLTWLNGSFVFHNGEFDGVEDTEEIIISSTGVTISITLVNGAFDLWGGAWTFADNTNAFPTSTVDGQQFFTLDEHGMPGDLDYVPALTLLIANGVGANSYSTYYKK